MPLEQKLALKLNESNIGYLTMNASVQGASTVQSDKDQPERALFCQPRPRAEASQLPRRQAAVARPQSQWRRHSLTSASNMMAYFEALGAMCDRMRTPRRKAAATHAIQVYS
jgi:hypothetical protein